MNLQIYMHLEQQKSQKLLLELLYKMVKNFTKVTRKHLCGSLFFKKPATLLKIKLWHSCFPVNFAKFLRKTFLKNTSEIALKRPTLHVSKDCNVSFVRFPFFSSDINCLWEPLKQQIQSKDPASLRCSMKKVLLNILQNS